MPTNKPPLKLSEASGLQTEVQPTDQLGGFRLPAVAPAKGNARWTAQTLADFVKAQVVTSAGGAPQWVAGPQTAGALVFNAGFVYRIKQNIANGQTAPTATNAYYLQVSYDDTAVLARLGGTTDQDPAAPLSAIESKVDKVVLANYGTAFLDAYEAIDAAPFDDTLIMRGSQPGFAAGKVVNGQSLNINGDAVGAVFQHGFTGSYGLNDRTIQPSTGYTATHRGGLFPSAELQFFATNGNTPNTLSVYDAEISGNGTFRIALDQADAKSLVDVVNIYSLRSTKKFPGTGNASGLISFQGNTYANDRPVQVNIYCELTAYENLPLFDGVLPLGSSIHLWNGAKLNKSGPKLQAVRNAVSVSQSGRPTYVNYADADLIVDHRDATGVLLNLTPALMDAVLALTYTNCDADPAASPVGSFPGQQFDAIGADGKNRHYYCTRPTYVAGGTVSAASAWHRFLKTDA
jgi:hypothetical protein